MRKTIVLFLFAVSMVMRANAQTVMPPAALHAAAKVTPNTQRNPETRGQGFVFVAPGFTSDEDPTMQLGGGGEAVFGNGVGVGADLSYLRLAEYRTSGGVGVFSLNSSYHFLKASKSGKLVPFVTAGYTGFFRSGAYANGFNYGGGINYWFHDHAGLRIEFRDQLVIDSDTFRYAGVRLGVSFR